MSPWIAFGLATAFLLAPWILMPRGRVREIRGITQILWFMNWAYCVAWHRLEVMNPTTLPEQGPAILISNHTCCIDHMLLQSATRRLLGFLIAKELYEFWFFRPFCQIGGCIPVRRDGNDVAAMRASLRMLEEGRVVPIFPEGRILATSGRELGDAKPGVAFIALRANVPVIPAYICGTPETNKVVRSYLTPSHARVYFGPPISLSDLIESGKVERDAFGEVTRRMMAAIHELRDQAQQSQVGWDRRAVMRGNGATDDGKPIESRPEALSVHREALGNA